VFWQKNVTHFTSAYGNDTWRMDLKHLSRRHNYNDKFITITISLIFQQNLEESH